MRHLFVPACLCLMTLPGATASDPSPPLDRLPAPAMSKTITDRASTAAETTKDLDDQATGADETEEASLGGESVRDKSQSDDDAPAATQDNSFDAGAALDDEDAARPIENPPLPPKPKPVVERSREEICDTLTKAAHNNDVPAPFFIRLLFQESRFQPGTVSSAGAEGIAQFMPETSADVGLANPFDPLQAIPAAARLLRSLAQQFGNLGLAAAAYNAGPKRIQEWLANKGKLPQETRGYVKTITGRAPETWTATGHGSPAVKLPRRAPCQEVRRTARLERSGPHSAAAGARDEEG